MNYNRLARIMREEGFRKTSSLHPKDWRPDPLLRSRLEYGADMENPMSSFFETEFGTYAHEPADGDAVYFTPRGDPRKVVTLGRGNFNTAKALAIKHYENLSGAPAKLPKSYRKLLAEALLLKKTKPKILKSHRFMLDGGWMEFPNGRILQFDLRGDKSPLMLVMETMGSEEEEHSNSLFREDSVDIPVTGNLDSDSDAVVAELMEFSRRNRDLLEA